MSQKTTTNAEIKICIFPSHQKSHEKITKNVSESYRNIAKKAQKIANNYKSNIKYYKKVQ